MAYATSSGPACTAACWSSSSTRGERRPGARCGREQRAQQGAGGARGSGQGVLVEGVVAAGVRRPGRPAGAARVRLLGRRLGRSLRSSATSSGVAPLRSVLARCLAPDISRAYSALSRSSSWWVPTAVIRPAGQQRHPVGEQHGRRAVRHDQRGRVRAAPGAARPRPAPRCARPAPTAGRPAPGSAGGRRPPGPARAAAAGRRTGSGPARRPGCRCPAAARATKLGLRDVQRPAPAPPRRRPSAPIRTFSPTRRREQRGLLEGDGDQFAQPLARHRGDVLAVQGDPPARSPRAAGVRARSGWSCRSRWPRPAPWSRRAGCAGRSGRSTGGESGGSVGVAEARRPRTAARCPDGRRRPGPPAAVASRRSAGCREPSDSGVGVHHLEVALRRPSPPPGSSPAGSRSTPPASAAPAPWTGTPPACPPTARRPRPGRAQHQRRADGQLGQGHDERPDAGQQPRLAQLGAPQPPATAPGRRGPGCGGGRSP